ncbi:RNase H domain-containing protein [Trichonephila clavipes]|nr:RNase H domain-containing protein [Trichonephila clavipes]
MHIESVESSNILPLVWCGRREGCQIRCRPRHLTMAQNFMLRRQKPSSRRDWGANANTLRTTYTSFIRLILEYGFHILLTACASNTKKLERAQLSAARIITGLRNCCPSEIVLYEANLQPLIMRWTSSTSKYYSKLYSYGDQHRTSTYLKNWTKVQRLKSGSSFSKADKLNLLFSDIEPCLLEPSMNPLKDLPRVFFHEEL